MILIVGANGMLGQDLMQLLSGDIRGVDIGDIDITSPESVKRVLLTLKPAVIINAAAYTDVDGCETNRELAMRVNGEGVGNLARIAAEIGARLVQISTDYVFDGGKGSPYLEDDPVNPLSVYGETKLAGEINARLAPDVPDRAYPVAVWGARQKFRRDHAAVGRGKNGTCRGG